MVHLVDSYHGTCIMCNMKYEKTPRERNTDTKAAAIREVKDLMSILGVTLKQVETYAKQQKLKVH
jgi:hypothetical protein